MKLAFMTLFLCKNSEIYSKIKVLKEYYLYEYCKFSF